MQTTQSNALVDLLLDMVELWSTRAFLFVFFAIDSLYEICLHIIE